MLLILKMKCSKEELRDCTQSQTLKANPASTLCSPVNTLCAQFEANCVNATHTASDSYSSLKECSNSMTITERDGSTSGNRQDTSLDTCFAAEMTS